MPDHEDVRSKEELRERNQFIETLINLSPDIIYIYDIVEQKNVYSNDGVQRILGYSAAEILAMGAQLISVLMHPDDFQVYINETLPRYADAKDHERLSTSYRMKHKDGEWRWLSSNELIYARATDGSPTQIFGMIHDITESKAAEAALRESKNALNHLIQNLHAAVIVHAADTHIIFANEQASLLLGLSVDQMMGKKTIDPAWCFIHEDEKPLSIEEYPVTQVFNTRKPIKNLVLGIIRPATNDLVWVMVNAYPELEPDGEIRQVVVTFIDITERKLTEDALAAEKQKLDESMQKAQKLESLGVLAGGIAHDFNNMLAGMFGFVEISQIYLEGNKLDKAKASLSNAFDVFDRAKALTQQLLTFSKGGAPIQKTIDLVDILKNSTRFSLSGSNVTCQFDIEPTLWLCDCDENQIGQVISNIVINAQQAMPVGGTVFVSAKNELIMKGESAKKFVKISFQDQGIGIEKSLLPKVFDPFFTTKALGQGLGLATVYSIVNRHGGWIDVESEPGKGTLFQLFLPASLTEPTTAPTERFGEHQGSGTVLIMDDEKVIQQIEGGMLACMGYDVVYAEDGHKALSLFSEAKARGKSFDLTILDLTIPNGMGGKETVREIRKIDHDAIIIVASGYADDPVMMRPTEFGFTDQIAKPFRKSALSALLEKHMRK